MADSELTRVLIERICNMTFARDANGLPDASSPTGEIWGNSAEHRSWLFDQTETTGLLTGDKEYVEKALKSKANQHNGHGPKPKDKDDVQDITTILRRLNVIETDSERLYDCMKAKIVHAHEDGEAEGAQKGLLLLARAIYKAYEKNQAVVDAVVKVGTAELNKLAGTKITEDDFKKLLTAKPSLLFNRHDW